MPTILQLKKCAYSLIEEGQNKKFKKGKPQKLAFFKFEDPNSVRFCKRGKWQEWMLEKDTPFIHAGKLRKSKSILSNTLTHEETASSSQNLTS